MRVRATVIRVLVTLALVAPAGVATSTSAQAVTCPPRLGLSYWDANFTRGTSIPYTGTNYVTQGLAYYTAKDWLITSLSDDVSNMPNALAIKTRSGTFVKRVYVKTSGGARLGGHMGGVSVAGGSLLVSTDNGTDDLFRFSMADLVNAAHNGSVRANGAWALGMSSYNTVAGDRLYVGTFSSDLTGADLMQSYHLSPGKAPELDTRQVHYTPTRVQGVVVADGWDIFSTSYGRNCYSRLKFRNRATGVYGRDIELPPMSEGIVNVPREAAGPAGNWLYVAFESASDQFPGATMPQLNFSHAVLTTLTP